MLADTSGAGTTAPTSGGAWAGQVDGNGYCVWVGRHHVSWWTGPGPSRLGWDSPLDEGRRSCRPLGLAAAAWRATGVHIACACFRHGTLSSSTTSCCCGEGIRTCADVRGEHGGWRLLATSPFPSASLRYRYARVQTREGLGGVGVFGSSTTRYRRVDDGDDRHIEATATSCTAWATSSFAYTRMT